MSDNQGTTCTASGRAEPPVDTTDAQATDEVASPQPEIGARCRTFATPSETSPPAQLQQVLEQLMQRLLLDQLRRVEPVPDAEYYAAAEQAIRKHFPGLPADVAEWDLWPA